MTQRKRPRKKEIAVREVDPEVAPTRLHNSAVFLHAEEKYSSFTGPLPPPEELGKYEAVLPGAADRVIRMAEGQAVHRQQIENEIVKGGHRGEARAQRFALIVALSALGLAAYSLHEHQPLLAFGIGGIDLVGLVAAFLVDRRTSSARVELALEAEGNGEASARPPGG